VREVFKGGYFSSLPGRLADHERIDFFWKK
jgi:hypothetical protein